MLGDGRPAYAGGGPDPASAGGIRALHSSPVLPEAPPPARSRHAPAGQNASAAGRDAPFSQMLGRERAEPAQTPSDRREPARTRSASAPAESDRRAAPPHRQPAEPASPSPGAEAESVATAGTVLLAWRLHGLEQADPSLVAETEIAVASEETPDLPEEAALPLRTGPDAAEPEAVEPPPLPVEEAGEGEDPRAAETEAPAAAGTSAPLPAAAPVAAPRPPTIPAEAEMAEAEDVVLPMRNAATPKAEGDGEGDGETPAREARPARGEASPAQARPETLRPAPPPAQVQQAGAQPPPEALPVQPVQAEPAPVQRAMMQQPAYQQAAVPVEALAVEINRFARQGLTRFEIRLDPPELGRVEVQIEVGRDGNTHTRLTVERAETLDLLMRDARALERALQSAGLKTDEGGLQFQLSDKGTGSGRPGGAPDGMRAGHEGEDGEADGPAPAEAPYRSRLARPLDLTI